MKARPIDLNFMEKGFSAALLCDRFILKGTILFILWNDQAHRPTHDVATLHSSTPSSLEEVCFHLEIFLMPPTQALENSQTFTERWQPDNLWKRGDCLKSEIYRHPSLEIDLR